MDCCGQRSRPTQDFGEAVLHAYVPEVVHARRLGRPRSSSTASWRNHDLFWHTSTIDELHVDLEAPLGGTREATFTAAPGSYRFYCRVPAHAAAGMRGTLTIR